MDGSEVERRDLLKLLASGAAVAGGVCASAAAQTSRSASSSPRDLGAMAVVRRNTEVVQGTGGWALFDRLFDESFVDHTPQPGLGSDKPSVLKLYQGMRRAFPDFRATIHWQTEDRGIVTTFKTYHGTHRGVFLGLPPSGKAIDFITLDAMRVRGGRITDHWGVADLYGVVRSLGGLGDAAI